MKSQLNFRKLLPLDSRYHTNDKCQSSLQWKGSHRWFFGPFLGYKSSSIEKRPVLHQGPWRSATFFFLLTIHHPFPSIQVLCPTKPRPNPSASRSPSSPPPFLVSNNTSYATLFVLRIEYSNKVLPQICLVPFYSLSKAWTVFHTCVYFLGNLPRSFALHLLDFFLGYLLSKSWIVIELTLLSL